MAVCKIEGNSDMYGLGIRLGYYFQWYGAILARWLAPSEVKNLAFSMDVFVAATFLALAILTAGRVDSLEPVETYIVLLLMFGAYLALVPIYVWRLLTTCDPYWVSCTLFLHCRPYSAACAVVSFTEHQYISVNMLFVRWLLTLGLWRYRTRRASHE
jgi:hypothetical protein